MYTLIDLPYPRNSLGPVISTRTLDFHFGKHLKTYVDNFNNLIAETVFRAMTLKEMVAKFSGALFKNAGQVLNHILQTNESGELSIAQYTNADNPVVHSLDSFLIFNVWEHSYYLITRIAARHTCRHCGGS